MVETPSTIELTREEIVARIEQGAQRRKRMSAGDRVTAYRAGRLEDPGKVADLLALASLLPEEDTLFVHAS